MNDIILLVLIIVLIILVVFLSKIFTRLQNNSDDLKNEIRKLNDKINSLSSLLKEKSVEITEDKSSVIDTRIPEAKKEEKAEEFKIETEKIGSTESISVLKEDKEKIEEIKIETAITDYPETTSVLHEKNKEIQVPEYKDTVSSAFGKKVTSIVEPKKVLDVEKLFGVNILSKIGIITLVLGIAYFVKYAIDQNWIGEAGRVAIGIGIGLGIIGIAHKLRTKYLSFSALLAGGGIAVLYITITLAFRQYELFSQTTAFIILILITVASVILSLFYNQKILAVFSILGGFSSPLLVSSGTGNYITLFSYIFILNTGMLVLAYRKKWFIVSLLSYFLTYIFYGIWLILSYKIENRTGALCFSALFFIQFYVLVLIEYFKSRKVTPYQVFVILSNNFLLYISLFYLFENNATYMKGAITFLMAGINTVPLILLISRKEQNTLFFRLLIGIIITFISLAVPIQLKGSAITMFWGVESVLLLWLYKKSRFTIFSFSFLVLQFLALLSLFIDYVVYYLENEEVLSIIINPVFIAGTVLIICLGGSLMLLRKEEKSTVTLLGVYLCSMGTVQKAVKSCLVFLVFIFPFTELTYQLNIRDYSLLQVALIQGVYIYVFTAAYIFICKNTRSFFYYFVSVLLIAYPLIYLGYVVSYEIQERFYSPDFSFKIFSLHFLTIPAFIYLIIYLCKNNISSNKDRIYWLVAVISVIALSLEVNNLALMIYDQSVLGNVYTIVYPIIWGIAALILIIVGMRRKILIVRKISLSLFALIILKLYLYDVWKMPQAGRIISFVVLGLILLGTSFLYQKLKIIIQSGEEEKKEDPE